MAQGYTLDQLKKMGAKPVQQGFTLQELQAQQKPTQKQPTFGGSIVRDITTPFARLGTNAVNAVQTAIGRKITQPFSGSYLGEVPAVGGDTSTLKGFGDALKDSFGVGLDVATTVAGGGGAAGVAKTGVKGLVKQAVLKGIKEGAIVGGGQGLAGSLENNDTFAETLTNTILSTIAGSGLGGLLGGATGAPKAIQKALKNKGTFDALEIIKPELTKGEKEAAIASGRGVTKGILGRGDVVPTPREVDIAKVAKPYLKPKVSIIQNVNSLKSEISNEAERLKSSIKNVDRAVNQNEFATKLLSIEKPVLLSSDPTLNNAYNLVSKKALNLVKEHDNNISGLLDARKSFDKFIEKQFPNLYSSETLTPMKSAIKDIRNEFNNFIDENLPQEAGFRNSLKKQSLLYEAVDNMSTKAAKELGLNRLQRIMKNNPKATSATKNILKIGGGAYLGSKILNN